MGDNSWELDEGETKGISSFLTLLRLQQHCVSPRAPRRLDGLVFWAQALLEASAES